MQAANAREVRKLTWWMLWKGRCFMRFMSVLGVFWLAGLLVQNLVCAPLVEAALTGDLTAALAEIQKGAVVAPEELLRLAKGASALRAVPVLAFNAFLNFVLTGSLAFAFAKLSLNALDGPSSFSMRVWGRDALSGLKTPFATAWLAFRIWVQMFLWTLLLVVPGLVAFYRYRFAWRVFADHPDWPAGKCIAESARMIKGYKRLSLSMDFAYWRGMLLCLSLYLTVVACMVASVFVEGGANAILAAIATAATFAVFPAVLVLCFSITLAQSFLYRLVKPVPGTTMGRACEQVSERMAAIKAADAPSEASSSGAAGHMRNRLSAFVVGAGVAIFAAAPGEAAAAGVNLPAREWAMVRQLAVNYELGEEQTWLLAAIRRHENGRAGLEFGIGGPMNSGHPAHRYRDGFKSFYIQGAWAAGTVKRHFRGDYDAFGKRYCPVSPGVWATRVRFLVRKLKQENGNRLPGVRPPKRNIDFP